MKRVILLMAMGVFTIIYSYSKPLFPDSETAKSEVELGVEGIHRLCPTGIWDHWTFRDIIFDRESNTVLLVIQLNSWSERKEEKSKQLTVEDAHKQAEWIVANLKEGYEELIKNPSISCDGDFMLYLTLGTLFKQMEKDGTNLRIMLLKPNYANQVFGDMPLELSSGQLSEPTISAMQLNDYLTRFQTLSSLLRAETKDNSVSEMLNKAERSDIVDTYKLIIELNNSLSNIYDANINKALLERAENMSEPLRKHQREVEPLISKVKNYKFVMFDLGDLLSEIKEYELTEDAETAARNLAQEYDVKRVLDYNFTNEILIKFISGELTEDEKHALYEACPNAFPIFKP